MWNVCGKCGYMRPDEAMVPNRPTASCPECGFPVFFRQLPLLLVTGASGTGKSTICLALFGRIREAVILDADILWRPEFNTPENNYREFMETWLRMCKYIGQSGRPVVLFGAGTGVPSNLEPCHERRFFSELHYLALTCDDEVMVQRLQQRQAHSPEFIAAQVQFNHWFIAQGAQPGSQIENLDTTHVPVLDTVGQVLDWVERKLRRYELFS